MKMNVAIRNYIVKEFVLNFFFVIVNSFGEFNKNTWCIDHFYQNGIKLVYS